MARRQGLPIGTGMASVTLCGMKAATPSGALTCRPALMAGATGLIGCQIIALWPGMQPLHLLVRRDIAPPGPATRVHVVDFASLPPLPPAQWAFCCLGTTIKVAGSRAAFRAVDFDAVVNVARAAREAGVERCAVVSALGAHAQSKVFYNRVKGEMEAALRALRFERLVIARPSLLAGERDVLGQPARLGERVTLALLAPVSGLLPASVRPIDAATVARAMRLALRTEGLSTQILESAALQQLGKAPA